MEALISKLVSGFESGALSRRQLVQGLALLAGSGPAVAAEDGLDFKTAELSHVSLHVADLQRSVDFYQRMFGFSVLSRDKLPGFDVVRVGSAKGIISLNSGGPAGMIDHFALKTPKFSKEAAQRYVAGRGAVLIEDPFAGFCVKDPDGVNVQIS